MFVLVDVKAFENSTVEPWSSLVRGDEGWFRPYGQTSLFMVVHNYLYFLVIL